MGTLLTINTTISLSVGKTTLTRNLVQLLFQCNIAAVAISLDDFYLPHAELKQLKAQHSTNPLLQGRGLPGTHDLALMIATLNAFGDPNKYPVSVPMYDKGAFGGEGDRFKCQVQLVQKPVEVLLVEGWMIGFTPPCYGHDITPEMTITKMVTPELVECYGLANLVDVAWIRLAKYVQLNAMMDHFIHWTPHDIQIVYKWRLEQERELRSVHGTGMTDDQVHEFVNRYMPLYQLCVPQLYHSRLWGPEDTVKVGSVHLRVNLNVDRSIESLTEIHERA